MSAKDNKTLAYINLYGILANLEILCEIDEKAKALASNKGKKVAIAFNVTDGPMGKLVFDNGCEFVPDDLSKAIGCKLFSCEHFNLMIEGKKNPVPYKGFFKLGFLLKNFQELTEILTKYLQPSESDMKNPVFAKKSTTLLFHLIARAMAQIANNDAVAKISARRCFDGDIQLQILDNEKPVVGAYLSVKDGKFTYNKGFSKKPRSFMEFADFDTARALFDGKLDAMTAVASGKVRMRGMIQQIDNANKILDKVGVYLA